jgi:maltooligosyltrehalose trehalohydrolase
MSWQPSLGAWLVSGGTHFRVWAPQARTVEVVLESPSSGGRTQPLSKNADGTFTGFVANVVAGERYRYRLDGGESYPDPASRFQPEGVHGPSEIVDPGQFTWNDAGWPGVTLEDLVIYELHVGTFTPWGTFDGVIQRLPYLAELGVTALELMPVADFPGQRNWGYDGVSLFAPARCYGQPNDLRHLVDAAHKHRLAVLLDVVYNHLGPDGNYLGAYSPCWFSTDKPTAWGPTINFDGPHSAMVRSFYIENALHWIHEYHIDGLRLDATHAIEDRSPQHVIHELAERVRATLDDRSVLLIAEDHRNLATMINSPEAGGWGLDAVWADDFHHQVRRHLAGDSEGYYGDFTGAMADLVATVRQGWFFCGQYARHLDEPRGSDPSGIEPRRFVHCLQNHDQIGNRALGERLHHQIDLAAFRAATVLLLCSPATPLLFMGQEWAASTPFLFFTHHHEELGAKVTEGRRQEFRQFSAFRDPSARSRIPDPQALGTFLASRLQWDERQCEPHASMWRLYRELLGLRRSQPALRSPQRGDFDVARLSDSGLMLLRTCSSAPALCVIVDFHEGGETLELSWPEGLEGWQPLLTTEDQPFSPEPLPPEFTFRGAGLEVRFRRPGAIIFQSDRPLSSLYLSVEAIAGSRARHEQPDLGRTS